MRPHGVLWWILVGAATIAGITVLAGVLAPMLRHGDDRALAAARDSLAIARADLVRDQRIHAQRESVYVEANAALDSVLRTPPKVVYVRVRAQNASPGLPDDTLRPDQGSGDTTMALVPLPAYQRLEKACSEDQSACAANTASLQTIIADLRRHVKADSTIVIETEAQAKRDRRAATAAEIRNGGLGVLVGLGLCAIFCHGGP